MGHSSEKQDREPLGRVLLRPLMRAAAFASGIIGAVWLFMLLLGKSFEMGEGLEAATVVMPVLAFAGFVILHWRNRYAPLRRFLLDFFLASIISFLVMQFVVARHLL